MAMEEIKPDDYKGFFPITANFNERTQLFYRKYAAGFKQIAERELPMVTASRKMSWDHPNKLDLPVHVIVDGRIVESGSMELAEELEKNGYERFEVTV